MDYLLLAAVVPPLFLGYRIYKMDSVEKEPVSLLIKLLVGGGLITFVASVAEDLLSVLHSSPVLSYWAAQVIENFIVVALTEELCKYIILKWMTWKNPEFNYTFDGVVYAVTVSLGFALVENIMYVYAYGINTAMIRAFTAIIAHAVFGVIMGYYYGEARKAASAGRGAAALGLRNRGILMAVLLHGLYDLTASQESELFTLLFLLIVVGMYIVTYRRLKVIQAADTEIHTDHQNPWS